MVLSNRAQIAEQDDSYRRGLILGLTMAEIVILIIFVLLLAFASLLAVEYEKRHKAEQQLSLTKQSISQLTERLSVLEDIAGGGDIEEFVRELIASQKVLNQLGDVQSRLTEANELIDKYEEVAKDVGVTPTPEEVAEALFEAKIIREALARVGENSVTNIIQESIELRTENKRMQGQIANALKKLKSLGQSNEMPSCWAKPDGTVEYIYEVAVTNNGMIVRETNLPHRKMDRKLLPISMIILNQVTSSANFRKMVMPLYQWSIEKKCRFYVRVFDLMGPTEKDLYKQRLKTVVTHFYRDFRIYKDF